MGLAPRAQVRRRQLAGLACLLWLLGVELLPGVHLALHDRMAAHRHEAGEEAGGEPVTRVRHERPHVHDGMLHLHGAAIGDVAAGDGAVAREPGAPARGSHGAHSLAHRALALHAAPPIVEHPLPVDHRPVAVAGVVAQLSAEAAVPVSAARGPPA